MDILVLAFLGKCASLQDRACVGAKLDCKAVIQRRGQAAVAGAKGGRNAKALAVAAPPAGLGKHSQNQSSGDASTSPAVLFELARRPSRLSGDGSLHRALRQNTGPSRRQLGRSRPRDSSDECTAARWSPGGVTGQRGNGSSRGSLN